MSDMRAGGIAQTSLNYTGQRKDGTGLLFYNARYYDPALGRFISADSIVPEPENPQTWNRFAYVKNNPLRYTDPTGHCSYDSNGNIDKWDCSVEEFNRMTIAERRNWMFQFMKQTRCPDCFNNILGVLDFLADFDLAKPDSWLSLVDSAILQGISLGWGDHLAGKGKGRAMLNKNSGKGAWKHFFDAYHNPRGTDPSELRRLWGKAEQMATDYGVEYAKHGINPRTGKPYNLNPTMQEWGLLEITKVYRSAVRNGVGDQGGFFDPFDPGQRKRIRAAASLYWKTTGALAVPMPFVP